MRTIAFVTQKGGTGKSTLASSVAVTARLAGEKVFVIDLDPLQSLVKWSTTRGKNDVAVEHVTAAKLPKVLSALEKKGVTLVVLDAPGHDGEILSAAVRAADLCIIPARPNVFDLWASEVTRAQVKDKGKDHVFLLNQCPPAQQNARVELGAKALQAMGGLLSPLLSSRVDYQEAPRLGLGVAEYNPHGVAADEIRELWSSIKRRLKKGAPAVKSDAKADAKPAVKAEVKATAKAETKPAAKIEAVAEIKDAKVEIKTDAAAKNEQKSEPKSAKNEQKPAKPVKKAA